MKDKFVNLRKYGSAPYRVAVIHGGPGASGEMAPLARELSHKRGVLEPLQTTYSIEDQVEELKNVLEKHAEFPLIMLGFSWGAWLSFIFAAEYPALIKKLILIGAGPFEQKYAADITEIRLSRMNEEEELQTAALSEILTDVNEENKDTAFAKLGKLISKVDAYDPIEDSDEVIDCRYDIYQSIWRQAKQLRETGELLQLAKNIQCPVIAIHGDYDPHPFEGVQKPLSKYITNFSFTLLSNCGHKPWLENLAKDNFYSIIKKELD